MAKLVEYITNKYESRFLDITIPEFEFFKVKLLSNTYLKRKIKTNEEEIIDQNYQIFIDRSEISRGFHQEISNDLKNVFQMNFAKFDWGTSTFQYYTSRYMSIEEKRQRLIEIFDYLKSFEKKYKVILEQSHSKFEQEKESFESYKDENLVIKYNEKLDTIVVLSLSFIGGDKFKLLANNSKRFCKFYESGLDKEFFSDLVSLKSLDKKTCFIIDPANYVNIKSLIEAKKKEQEEFIEQQEKVIEEYAEELEKYQYTEKNPFDFKLILNKEKKVFEFYCRGYQDNNYAYGYSSDRGIFSQWALDMIFSEYLDLDAYTSHGHETHEINSDITLPHYYKIKLDYQKDNSINDKVFYVPLDNFENIKKIYNNFIEQNNLFNRPLKSIKINHLEGISYRSPGGVNLNKFPSIYIDEKNNILFTFKFLNRAIQEKKDKNGNVVSTTPPSLTMRGVNITFEEMVNLLENHPLSEYIKKNTIFLNSEGRLNARPDKSTFTTKEREEVWDTLFMHAKLAHEFKKEKVVKKTRSLKI